MEPCPYDGRLRRSKDIDVLSPAGRVQPWHDQVGVLRYNWSRKTLLHDGQDRRPPWGLASRWSPAVSTKSMPCKKRDVAEVGGPDLLAGQARRCKNPPAEAAPIGKGGNPPVKVAIQRDHGNGMALHVPRCDRRQILPEGWEKDRIDCPTRAVLQGASPNRTWSAVRSCTGLTDTRTTFSLRDPPCVRVAMVMPDCSCREEAPVRCTGRVSPAYPKLRFRMSSFRAPSRQDSTCWYTLKRPRRTVGAQILYRPVDAVPPAAQAPRAERLAMIRPPRPSAVTDHLRASFRRPRGDAGHRRRRGTRTDLPPPAVSSTAPGVNISVTVRLPFPAMDGCSRSSPVSRIPMVTPSPAPTASGPSSRLRLP